MNRRIRIERERYTHHPVPSEVSVSKELDRTSGVDKYDFYIRMHRGHERKAQDQLSQIMLDMKSIASEK